MRHRKFLALALFSTSAVFASSANAQSNSLGLGVELTATDGGAGDLLGGSVAISGNFIVAGQNGCECGSKPNSAYVFEKQPGGWTSETQAAKLTASAADDYFGEYVGISSDTIVVSGKGKAYIFAKGAAGWSSTTETAQLVIPEEFVGTLVAIDGDTVVVSSASGSYIFVEPSGGWSTTSAYQAKMDAPAPGEITSIALNGNTLVMGFQYNPFSEPYPGLAFVFEKPASGWATTKEPTARLSTTAADAEQAAEIIGARVAVFGDTIAVSLRDSGGAPAKPAGIVDLFVKPKSGWTDASETAELSAPLLSSGTEDGFGATVSLDDSHLVAGSFGPTFVFSKPPTGWKSGAWPSQQFVGVGDAVLDGANVIAGDAAASGHGHTFVGAVYVFTLFPNWIQASTNLLEFPDISFHSSEVVPLTVTNVGTGTLNFTTYVDSANYQVLQTAENTCLTGVMAGQSCVLPIQFKPGGVGIHTNHLTLSSPSSASIRTIDLRGTAVGVGKATEGILGSFNVDPGKTETLPLVLANFGEPGSPTVALSTLNPPYSVTSSTCGEGIAEGQTCTVMIQFAPTSGGEHDAKITLTPSEGPASVVTVNGYSYQP